jgi:hypothetical protein
MGGQEANVVTDYILKVYAFFYQQSLVDSD